MKLRSRNNRLTNSIKQNEKEYFQFLLKSTVENLALLGKLGIGLGICLTVAYCVISIQFFPSGLTIGDSFFFVAIALAFGGAMIGFNASSALIWFWIIDTVLHFKTKVTAVCFTFISLVLIVSTISYYQRTPDWAWLVSAGALIIILFFIWKKKLLVLILTQDSWNYLASMIAFFSLFITAVSVINSNSNSWKPILALSSASFLSGFTSIMAWKVWINKKNNIATKPLIITGLLLFAVVSPLLIPNAREYFIKVPFNGLGLLKNNITVSLSPSNMARLYGLLPRYSNSLIPCKLDKEEWVVVRNANILWHGIGQRSLIEIPANSADLLRSKSKNTIRLEFDSAGVTTSNSTVAALCLSIPDVSFSTNSNTLTDRGVAQLLEALEQLSKDSTQIEMVEVHGFADYRPVKGGNYLLSTLRAENIKRILSDKLNIDDKQLQVMGKGATEFKSTCSLKLLPIEVDDCLALNRRVEIKVYLRLGKQ